MNRNEQIKQLEKEWNENPRWADVERPYTAEEVVNLRSSVNVEYTLAKLGAEKFWNHLQGDEPICALGAVTGNQAVQEVQAGLKAIYCSGWQVAGDNNSAGKWLVIIIQLAPCTLTRASILWTLYQN